MARSVRAPNAGFAVEHSFPVRGERFELQVNPSKRDESRALESRNIPLILLSHIDYVQVVSPSQAFRELERCDRRNIVCRGPGSVLSSISGARGSWLIAWAADLLVIGELVTPRCAAARTLGIAAKLDRPEAHRQCVDQEQATHEHVADAGDELDALGCLHRSDDPGKNSQYTSFSAVADHACRWWLPEETAITRRAAGRKDRQLPFEPVHTAVNAGNAGNDRRVVDEIARRKIVGSVDHNIESTEDPKRVVRRQTRIEAFDDDIRICRG